jgi:predicted ATPase/DNA-binding SARP family transcriptional activator
MWPTCQALVRFGLTLQASCKVACNTEYMQDGLDIRVLGSIEVIRHGMPIPIGGSKPRLALALLTAHLGSVVSTDRICDELWGENQPADPAAVLQSHLSRLRRLLRPDAEIVARPPGYLLDAPPETIDAGRFELLCQRAAIASDPRIVVDLLQHAQTCWRGPPFDEFGEHEWAGPAAVRLGELRANASADLFEARLALGGDATLVGDLEAAVVEQPLRERLWCQLVIALFRGGRTAEALRRAEAFRVLMREELGLDPSPAMRDLEAQVLNEDPTLLHGNHVARQSLPRRRTSETTRLVGRSHELQQLMVLVRSQRMITLNGPGGVGKTRLAKGLLNQLWDEFDGEVFVAELAAVHDPASTVAALATAVDVQQRQHLSVEETLIEYLRSRRALLVLDNCEHLRPTVASLSERLLSWCPHVTLLATSREVLGLPGEQVWRVGPLQVPEQGSNATVAVVAQAPAAQLFVERAIAARPGFALGPDNVVDVVRIVRRLDGLPLTLELAAARIRSMSLSALADRIEDGFELLSGAQASLPFRHRTVEDLVAWSYDLLDHDEQLLFARLSVFTGSFELDAAEGVCGERGLSASMVSMLLANLVDKSMVQVTEERVPRYRLLETLRDYGRHRLDDTERDEVRARHARWYLELSEECAVALTGPDEPNAVVVLDRGFENLRAAHSWSIEQADVDVALRLVASLREYGFRCMRAEITGWADAAAALRGAAEHARYPVVVAVSAYGRYVRGDVEGAIDLGERALAAADRLHVDCSGLAERALCNAWFYRGEVSLAIHWIDLMVDSAKTGSAARLAHAFYMRSVGHTTLGEGPDGFRFAQLSHDAALKSGSPTALAQALYATGFALTTTQPEEAKVSLQEAADIARNAGNRWIQAFALTEVLEIEANEGRPRHALSRYTDVIDLWYRGGDWANQWLSLRHVFGILVEVRADLGASTLHGALTAAGAAYALPFRAADGERMSSLEDDLRNRLGSAAFASAVKHGAGLSDGEIVEFVRGQISALKT